MSFCTKSCLTLFVTVALTMHHASASVSYKFSVTSTGSSYATQHADLNRDGREDFLGTTFNATGFYVQLSSGDGTYSPQVTYTLPEKETVDTIDVADFTGSGNAELVVGGFNGATDEEDFYLYSNNGAGKFTLAKTYAPNLIGGNALVGDFNHDGKMDLAFIKTTGVTQSMAVLFGDGKGDFTQGPETPTTLYGNLMLGDFDGDGYADIAIGDYTNHDSVEVLFGDGTGYFPTQTYIHAPQYSSFSAGDVNSDGTTDILASTYYPSTQHVSVWYGSSSRDWALYTTIPIEYCVSSSAPAVADMDGNGINDLIVLETDCGSNGSGYNYVGVLTRNDNATYNPDQVIYKSPAAGYPAIGPMVIRGNADTKPDLAIAQGTNQPTPPNPYTFALLTFLNTSAGDFPTCAAPDSFTGINVCGPITGSTVSSPVAFAVGASGQVPMRKVEVWVDGVKEAEQLDGFSNYSFFNRSLNLNFGTHKVDIYAAGWDNSLQEKTFTFTTR